LAAEVDRANVQGPVFYPYPCPHARILLFAFGDAAGGRKFLGDWRGRLTTAAHFPFDGPDPLANLSVSWAGLRALGAVAEADRVGFPGEFVAGPEAAILGDYGDSAPGNWWNGRFATKDIHLAFHLYARTEDALAAATAGVRGEAAAAGMRELLPLPGPGDRALTGKWLSPDGRELHFGYRDGFSQPDVNWDDAPRRGTMVDLRHVLLGYANEDVPSSPRREPWLGIARDGTYAVIRWLSQDVPRFEEFLTENGPSVAPPGTPLDEAREFLAAKIMGRWRDGTPLVLSPNARNPDLAPLSFDYANDQEGKLCPFAAHIRIAHRRDDPLSVSNSTFAAGTPRVVRRGMSYGPKYTGDGAPDGVDRGIVGTFLCASINRQFYPLTRWMHTTNFRDVFQGDANVRQDPLVGNRSKPGADTSFAIPKATGDEVVLRGLPDFVKTHGTAFMLMPSLSGLARLAASS
jgi:deferrochelatase/peroxidase EfeB